MPVVLCYGDSNTYGRDARTKGRLPKRERWPGVMQKGLGEEGLNGRTTVWDDPVRGGSKRNGGQYLLPCLESHSPLDLVMLMLGTNDCKARFAVTAHDIAQSIGYLIEIVRFSKCGQNGATPRDYQDIASQYGCDFFDTASVSQASRVDGLHIDPEDHRKLGEALAELVRKVTA